MNILFILLNADAWLLLLEISLNLQQKFFFFKSLVASWAIFSKTNKKVLKSNPLF